MNSWRETHSAYFVTSQKALTSLSNKSLPTMTWLEMRGLTKLAKSGSKMEQRNHPVSYREAKTLVKQKF